MKPRNLAILALLAVGLAAFILFFERHQPTTEEARQRADKVFPNFDRDKVEGLTIHNSHGDFTLAKKDGAWRLTAPIDFPADSSAVSSLLGSLSNLKQDRRLDPSEVKPEDYGLDTPKISVKATATDGGSFELAVGEETALGSKRAVRRNGSGDILLCAGWFVNDLDKPLDDWRSRDVIDVAADQVASLQVVAGSDRIQVARDGAEWKLLEPVSDLADRDQVRGLITDLNGLRVQDFVDGEPDLAKLGLAKPAFQLTIVRNGGAAPVELDLGATRDKDGSTQIACRRNASEVFWVKDDISTRLAKAPVRWRSPKVFPFDTWNADKLSVSEGDRSIALEHSSGQWKTAAGGEVDTTAVQERLTALSNLEAKEYDLLAPTTQEMGSASLEVRPPGGESEAAPTTVTYSFYRPLAKGGDAMVTVSGRSTVMSADAEAVAKILADPPALVKPKHAEPTVTPAEGD